ncbi:hypothetical protein ACSSS7_005359 [Eimeria intestinalis]
MSCSYAPRLSPERSSSLQHNDTTDANVEEDAFLVPSSKPSSSISPSSSQSISNREEAPEVSGGGRVRLVLTGFCFCLSLLLLFFLPTRDILKRVVEAQREQPLTYVLTYTVAGLLVPAPLLSVLAGVLLGASISGVFVIMCGSLGAACVAFFLSRYLLRQFVLRNFVMRSKQLQAIDIALRSDSLKLVLCTRMLLPYTFNNYFLGATSVSTASFVFATAVTGLPFAVVYAIIGGELQSLDSALAADGFEVKREEFNFFGLCTITKRQMEISGICAGLCLFFFVVRTVKQFADRVLASTQQAVSSPDETAADACSPDAASFRSIEFSGSSFESN